MTPEQELALTEHISAIAKILYDDTSPEDLNSLESIEATVREKIMVHVSPQMGFFLSKKRREHQPESSEH